MSWAKRLYPYVLRAFLGLVLVLAIPAAMIGYSSWRSSHLHPPPSVRTLDDLLAWRTPGGLYLITRDGQQYLEAQGLDYDLGASGPPGYVFDEKGSLIDWTTDSGDDSKYQHKWHRFPEWRPARAEEVSRFIQRSRQAR